MNKIISIFKQISQIPRESGNEKALREWLINWATQHNFEYQIDKKGNLVIKNKVDTDNSPIVLQSHLDMVCQKTIDSKHDFSKDPITMIEEDGWLKSQDTSLGADNGIGISIMLQTLLDMKDKKSIELLFTVEEEIGLYGANALKDGFIKGKYFINLDSEEEGVVTVGCAGGKRAVIKNKFEKVILEEKLSQYNLKLFDFEGGHSGVDINKGRNSAIMVMNSVLVEILAKGDLYIVSINGGTAANAIPANCEAEFVTKLSSTEIDSIIKKKMLKFQSVDSNAKYSLIEQKNKKLVISLEDSQKLIRYIQSLPNGVLKMVKGSTEMVETSCNLGVIGLNNDEVILQISFRSSNLEKLNELTENVIKICEKSNFKIEFNEGYPSWTPNFNSKLLKVAKETYKKLFNKELNVEVTHGGLECGVILNKYPDLDAISIGPTIENPHSVEEKLEIKTVEKTYNFLISLIKEL